MSLERSGHRILIVAINYAPEPTGIAPYTSRIAEGLNARGHDVRVLTTFPHYPQWRVTSSYSGLHQRERRGVVHVRRLKHYVPRRPEGVRRALSEVSFGMHAALRGWGRPDVVLCPSPALLSSALVRLRTRSAFGLQLQDLYSVGMTETGGGRGGVVKALTAVERQVARHADGVAVIHERFRDRVVGDLGVDPERVRVIRNWTHLRTPERPDPVALRHSLGWGDDFVVLHAGAMGQKQALFNVIETAKLADRRGLSLRFVLLGDGGQRSALETDARGVHGVQFVDPLPEESYRQALHAANVLLVNERPGVAEMAVPSKLTSYFSTGRPVVAATGADSTTAEELTVSGAGVRVNPGDPAALLEAVVALRNDPAKARQFGANGPAYCERVLSETSALDAYDEWVGELVERHRKR